MSHPKIKICGLTRWSDVKFAADKGVDFLGFILAPNSPRCIDIDRAKQFVAKLDIMYPDVGSVAVVVRKDLMEIDHIIKSVDPDYIQVHNDMKANDFNKIDFENKIKVLRVNGPLELSNLSDYKAKYFLFDTYVKGQSGGTGKTFDWQWIPKEILCKSFISGGIDLNNMTTIIKDISPFAIDMNSGLETEPGIKSHTAIVKAVDKLLV